MGNILALLLLIARPGACQSFPRDYKNPGPIQWEAIISSIKDPVNRMAERLDLGLARENHLNRKAMTKGMVDGLMQFFLWKPDDKNKEKYIFIDISFLDGDPRALDMIKDLQWQDRTALADWVNDEHNRTFAARLCYLFGPEDLGGIPDKDKDGKPNKDKQDKQNALIKALSSWSVAYSDEAKPDGAPASAGENEIKGEPRKVKVETTGEGWESESGETSQGSRLKDDSAGKEDDAGWLKSFLKAAGLKADSVIYPRQVPKVEIPAKLPSGDKLPSAAGLPGDTAQQGAPGTPTVPVAPKKEPVVPPNTPGNQNASRNVIPKGPAPKIVYVDEIVGTSPQIALKRAGHAEMISRGSPNTFYSTDRSGLVTAALAVNIVTWQEPSAGAGAVPQDMIEIMDLKTRENIKVGLDAAGPQGLGFTAGAYTIELVKGENGTQIIIKDKDGKSLQNGGGMTVETLDAWRFRSNSRGSSTRYPVHIPPGSGRVYMMIPQLVGIYGGYAFVCVNNGKVVDRLMANVEYRDPKTGQINRILDENGDWKVNLGRVGDKNYNLIMHEDRPPEVVEGPYIPPFIPPSEKKEEAGANAGGGSQDLGPENPSADDLKNPKTPSGSKNISDHDDALVKELVTAMGGESVGKATHDPSGKYEFIIRARGGLSPDNRFYLFLYKNKIIEFPGVLACHKKDCFKEENGNLVVEVVETEELDPKVRGTWVEWVDLDERMPPDPTNTNELQFRGYAKGEKINKPSFGFSKTHIFRIPKNKLKEQKSSGDGSFTMPPAHDLAISDDDIPLTEISDSLGGNTAGSASVANFKLKRDDGNYDPDFMKTAIIDDLKPFDKDETNSLFSISKADNRKALFDYANDRIAQDRAAGLNINSAWTPTLTIFPFLTTPLSDDPNANFIAATYANLLPGSANKHCDLVYKRLPEVSPLATGMVPLGADCPQHASSAPPPATPGPPAGN